MELLFLGTSSGTPTKTRNVSALALRLPGFGHWYLVDCGEGTQHRILHTSLSLANLRAIFITHIHGDHCYGLPGLLASAGMLNRTSELLIVGPEAVRSFIEGVMETTQLRLPYSLEFVSVEEAPVLRQLPDFDVQATQLSHRVASYAYSFQEKIVENKLDVAKLERAGIGRGPDWGMIQQGRDVALPGGEVASAQDYLLPARKPRKIVIGGDNDSPALLRDEARTTDVLVHEATYTEDMLRRIGPAPQHSSAHQVAQLAEESQVRNLVLTHFSPRYQEQGGALPLAQIEAEARAVYKGNLFLAKDFDHYVLDRQGILVRAT